MIINKTDYKAKFISSTSLSINGLWMKLCNNICTFFFIFFWNLLRCSCQISHLPWWFCAEKCSFPAFLFVVASSVVSLRCVFVEVKTYRNWCMSSNSITNYPAVIKTSITSSHIGSWWLRDDVCDLINQIVQWRKMVWTISIQVIIIKVFFWWGKFASKLGVFINSLTRSQTTK